ncbi:WD repeat-containing protein 60 isoform X3 [Echeneis naucrates]|uniref:WD repeat-containing protein 60 isoform X3 n=1 Tax=Echeneis naucrates TaxID=173247 RepID=UPI0011136491|nr:WD repeat-containing protein 60 isoform X3 [Echeneis naucrates]
MHSGKKITKEDTWRPADLRRYIRQEGHGDEYVRRRDDNERRHRSGESVERYHNQEKESRQERDKRRQQDSTRERRDDDVKVRYTEKSKERSQDRRSDKERDKRDEKKKETEKGKERDRRLDGNKYGGEYREDRDQRRDREEKHDRERDKEKDRAKNKERHNEEEKDKRKEERDAERRREEHHREHKTDRERRRHEERGEKGREQIEKHDREQRDRYQEREQHKDYSEDKRNYKERRERHGERKHSEYKDEREYREEHRRHKEERERRHKERKHTDEKKKHASEPRNYQDLKRSGEEERHHHVDRERAEWNKQKERSHKGEEDPDKKYKERRYRDEEDPEKKYKERRHRDEEDPEKKYKQRRHRDEEDPEKKYKERRHRDEEDRDKKREERKDREESNLVRHHRETNNLKKSTSNRTDRHEKGEKEEVSEHWTTSVKDVGDTEVPVVNDEDLADQEYEDDFEDYEEDFEEMDQSENEDEKEPEFPQLGDDPEELLKQKRKEIAAIQRAMNEENERVGTTQSSQSMRKEEDMPKQSRESEKKSRTSPRGKFIDFVAAKQREVSKKVATKQKKRSTELLRLIDLDFSMTLSLLDLPPVNEYDMYIRTFGTLNTKQAYVQCNEDNADREIQTEEIEVCEKWTQHPPEHNGACGDPNLSQRAQEKNMSEMNFDSQRLTAFLRSASQVMVVLLEEAEAERQSLRNMRTQPDALSFSDGSLQLNTKLPFLYGRHISLVHFSQAQRHNMMSVHTPTTQPSAVHLDSCTIICIWNIWEPSRPQKILVYESEVQSCCFNPGKAILVFAGTSVGSVVLWDLREHASNHYHLKIGEDEWTFRQPTFSTDAVMAGAGHFSSVMSVEVVPSNVTAGLRPEDPLLASEEELSGLSFQLASLDERGILNFWVVVELPKANEAGSPTDLGLRPGGKVKLLHSSSLLTAERVSPRDAVKTGPLQTLHLKFLPTDSNHFFIGTNLGLVSHGTSHGLKVPPKFYNFQEAGIRPVDVTSIHFSPFRQNMFLVGCADGSIRLHAVRFEQPLVEWKNSTSGEAVVSLQWTQTRPTVFCVLDAASNLHIWDLMKNDTEPVVTERMPADRVTGMSVFGNSGPQNTYSGIALVHESGKIVLHNFTRNVTVPILAEEEKLENMMTEAF